MAIRTSEEIYQTLIRVGFTPDQATTMTAIALGESSGNDDTLGDVSLQDSYWGPSFGLFQIRTIKGMTGTGDDRDISALTGDITRQAQAAYTISKAGTDFTPWTVFNTGKYKEFLDRVTANAGSYTAGLPSVGEGLGNLKDVFDNAATQIMGHAKVLTFLALSVALGLGLIITGGWRGTS